MSAVALLTDVIVYGAVFAFLFLVLNKLLSMARAEMAKPHPLIKPDDFFKEHGYSFDFVFVFKVYTEGDRDKLSDIQKTFSMKNVLDRLHAAELETRCFYSCQRDEVYVKIRVAPNRLKKEAARIDYKLKLDYDRLKIRAQTGKAGFWKKISISDEYQVSTFEPWEYIYAPYRLDPEVSSLYQTYEAKEGKKHIFRSVDRIKLLMSIIEAKPFDGGCGIYLSRMLVKRCVLAAFPIHDYEDLIRLQDKWLVYSWPWQQPFDDITDYFGERIGLYFHFIGYYTSALFVPAILGCVTFAVQKIFGETENFLMPVFASFMVIWSTFFIEFWKRRQSTIAMKHGMTGFESDEQDRPQFKGIRINSPVDGEPMLYFIEAERDKRRNIVLFAISCAIATVFGVVGSTFVLQIYLTSINDQLTILGFDSSTLIIPLLNSAVIAILNILYSLVVYRLNDYENHRTDTNYEDSLVYKLFIFQMVNCYAALTYVSFVKGFLGITCSNNDCIGDVATTLSTVFITRLLTQVSLDVFVKKAMQLLKNKQETSGLEPGSVQSPIEAQYVLNEYHVLVGAMVDYSNIVIQYGYTVLFVAAFPIAPALAFGWCYVIIRIHGWKLCQIHRRPQPKSAEDVGKWQDMVEILSVLAVIYNFGLIFFTSHYFVNISWAMRWILFILVEHFCFALKFVLAVLIEDVPEDVDMQLKRQDFLVSKVIENAKDDQEQAEDDQVQSSTNVMISKTDYGWIIPEDESKDEGFALPKFGGAAASPGEEDYQAVENAEE